MLFLVHQHLTLEVAAGEHTMAAAGSGGLAVAVQGAVRIVPLERLEQQTQVVVEAAVVHNQ
jgi:hypothetical protein